MEPSRRHVAGALSRSVLLVLVVGGLLTMHGLDLHDAGHAPGAEMAMATSGPDGSTVGPAPAALSVGMAGLCVAVLAGVALVLLTPRRTTGGVPARLRPADVTPLPRGRDRAPPPLPAVLSVCRC